jgi:hypothetical protein
VEEVQSHNGSQSVSHKRRFSLSERRSVDRQVSNREFMFPDGTTVGSFVTDESLSITDLHHTQKAAFQSIVAF